MRFLADENFNNDILRGVIRRLPNAQFTRVQDTSLLAADDMTVLDYAASNGFLLLTHDVNTLRGFFYERMRLDLPLPGVFLVHKHTPIGLVIDALELIILASSAEEWVGKITYLP